MAADKISDEDKVFLEQCEVEFKDRYTGNDEDYMKVFHAEPSTPPIIENWWVGQHYGRRNDRRNNKRKYPYDDSHNGERDYSNQGYQGRNHQDWGKRSRGYQDRSYKERAGFPAECVAQGAVGSADLT
ncbi:RNA guanine-N7 methyltransferase activating subunit [Battus philenor]|uniref:RNA guanine-N7 methyltransferase activating subunit n=1 Tax=Battus philenor TaxID=42288 RepID=UPI0035D1027B